MEFAIKIENTITSHSDRVWSVDWSAKNNLLTSGSGDKTAKIWNNNVQISSFTENRTIRRVKFSPDGAQLAACSFNGQIHIYKFENGDFEEYAELEGHESEVKSIAWSADGSLLATCGRDKSVWIWECWEDGDYECSAVLTSHSADVKDVCFHPSENILLSASYDMTIKVYKELNSEWDCAQTITGHTDTVWCIKFSPDGNRFASGGSDNCVRIWTKKSDGNYVLESNIQGLHGRTIYSIDWNETGILTGSGDNKVRLLVEDKENGWTKAAEIEFESDVNSVAWAKCGSRAAAGTDDGEIVLLNISPS